MSMHYAVGNVYMFTKNSNTVCSEPGGITAAVSWSILRRRRKKREKGGKGKIRNKNKINEKYRRVHQQNFTNQSYH